MRVCWLDFVEARCDPTAHRRHARGPGPHGPFVRWKFGNGRPEGRKLRSSPDLAMTPEHSGTVHTVQYVLQVRYGYRYCKYSTSV